MYPDDDDEVNFYMLFIQQNHIYLLQTRVDMFNNLIYKMFNY